MRRIPLRARRPLSISNIWFNSFTLPPCCRWERAHRKGNGHGSTSWARAPPVDLLGVLAEKTRGNLSSAEESMLQSALFEARMAFLELTSMMSVQPVPPPPAKK